MRKCLRIAVNYNYVYIRVLFLLIIVLNIGGENLYVYYPSTLRPNIVQQKAMGASPDVTVTVFGKYRDFQMRVETDKPDAILTKSETATDFTDFDKQLLARRSNGEEASYLLLSIDPLFTKESITEKTVIGTVDFMKRGRVTTFVHNLVGVKSKVKHVTKVEDLLPLLSFKMADAVVLNERDIQYFKKRSNLKFVTINLATDTVVATISAKEKSGKAVKVATDITRLLPDYLGGVEWGM